MPPWGLAKKPVKLFLNFSFGQFLSQPLEDDQILITSNGIGCKDIYFNIDKLNALLSESGIPLVVCVAYISEVVICLPWSVEINGIDFVVQATSEVCSPSGTDELFNSMISSVTTAAFAVAKAADTSTIPKSLFEESVFGTSDVGGVDVDTGDKEKIPKNLHEQAYQFFENLTAAAETISVDTKGASSYVDQDSKQRIAHMIDSLVAQTSIVLRDVSIRVECELRLPGLDRASGLTLTVKHLSISNQYKTEEKHPPSSSSHTTSGGRWSWLWWWHGSNNGSSTGKGSVISSSPTSTSTPLGSLSTMLHKIIHLEEANLFWDLWSTSGQVQGCSSLSSSPHRSEPPCSPLPNKKTCGPTADTMVSSAKLLTLSGSEHTARLSLRVGSVLSTTPNCSPSTVQSDNSMKPNNSNTSTTANNLSDFQLRLHVDLGPIVACAYPSQFYWLQMMFGQLVHIYEDYVEHRKSISEQRKLENDMTCYYSDLLTHNHLSNMMRENNNCLNIVTPNLDNHICNYSNHDHFQKLYSTSPELTETHLIDLDLSDNTRDSQNFTSTMLNSELFRSCLTDVSTSTMHEDNATLNHVDHHYVQKTAGMRNLSQVTTKYSISANILCLAFVAFYEDESVLTNNQTVEGIAFSSNLNSMHKYRFNGSELNHHKSFNSDVELNEEVSKHAETYHTSEYHHQSNDCISKMNVNSIHNTPPAALPGPSIFFARFHGLIPTPNCQSTKNNLETGDRIHFKCQPMSINREEVDTGRMSSSEWVAHLKHQLSNMAYPRDHLCFVGGLWHLEFSNNHLTTIPNVNRLTSQNYFTQLCFNIQLFGIHLSECLFLDDDITTIKNKAEMIMNGQDKKMESFELLHFPYNSSSSSSSSSSFSGSDRLSRSSSNEPAIKLNGTLYIPQNEVDSRPRITSSSQISQNFVNELQIDITHFCVDWDISIMDRIHRITDALAAASEAVGRLSPLRPSDFNHHAKWYDTDIPVTTRSDHQRTEFTSVDKSSRSPAYNVSHTPDYPFEHVNFSKSYSSSVNLIIKCCSFEFNLRFPVPLEAIKGAYNQKVTEMRTKLWGCGNLYNFNQLNLIKNISWWKKTLRKEYLSLFMKKICLTINNYKDSNEKFQYETNDHLQNIPKSKLSSNIGTNKKHTGGNEQEVELLIGSISIHLASDDTKIQSTPIIYFTSKPNPGPESIKVYIRITPSGRTDLIECINENPMSKDFDDVPIISQQSSYFEVGVDLTAYKEHNNSSSEQFSYSRRRSTSDESSVEWSLWNQANPKQNCCTPLVIRRNFVQDAPKPHSKQISYYPGNKMHMSSYRQSASMHTHLFVHIKVPVAEITIEQKQTVELLCLRLMYDLLLWQSLLPNDRRLRATLKRPNNSSRTVDPVANSEVDHRYWFLSDPAPLASIYAHPEAARAAAELEAISPIGYHNVCHPSGLHYHSVRSDDDDDDSDDIKDEMNEVYANIENPVVNRCSTHFNTENVKHPKWKNVWSNDLRKNFYSKTSINPNISSRQHTSSLNQHRYDNNDNNNSNIDNNDNVDGYHNVPLTNTSVQYQSSICFQLDVTSTQLTTFLPESSVGCQLKEKVIVKATNTILFAEIAHNSNPFLNYIEMEIGEFDISYCCNQNPNSDHHHSPSEGTNSSDSPKNIWPVLIHLSWDSIGYPYGSSLHQFGVSSPNSSNEPMISLALEHRQTHHLSDSGYSTYDDEFILALRIQDICFIYWPLFSVNNRWDIFSNIGSPAPSPLNTNPSNYFNYTYHTTANMSNSSNLNHLIGLPNWFIRFSNLWQTPSLPIITKEYPSYHAPDCLFSQHLHFEHLTVNFQMPYPEYSILSANKPTCINYQLLPVLLHFMIGCESASITVNTAMEMLTINSSINQNNSVNQVDMQPGMLVMAFINNLALFIFPAKITSTNTTGNILRTSEVNHTHPLLTSFRNWLNTLDLNKAVCVASLDHLELRCFSEPVILPNTIDNSDSSQSLVNQNSTLSRIVNQFDMRITNNLLKINTCADSLVVLHKLVELLSVSETLPTNHLSPSVTKIPSPAMCSTDSGVKRFNPSSSSVSSPIHLHCSRNILDNKGKSGSGSSLDLIQDAISDVESVPSSPLKNFNPKRSSAVDIPSNISRSSKNNDSFARRMEQTINDGVIPVQPCRIVHNNGNSTKQKTIVISKDIRPSNPISSPSTSPTAYKSKEILSVDKTQLYPDLSNQLKSTMDETHTPFRPSSLSDDFVFIDPSTVPALNYSTPKEKIRCLLQPSMKISECVQTSLPSFDIHENFYSPPSSASQTKSHLINRWNRLFTDPVKIYPHPLLAITLYDVSFEWNIYGGNDLIPSSATSSGSIPPNEISIPVRSLNKSPTPSSPLKNTSDKLITPSHSNESPVSNKTTTNTWPNATNTGNLSSPNQMSKVCPKPGYRFRHGRPVIHEPGPAGTSGGVGLKSNKPKSEQVSLQSISDPRKGIRSRQLLYSQGGPGRQIDNCISFNISKLYFRHAKFPARMKKSTSQNGHRQQHSNLFNLTVDPFQRLVIHISSIVILDRVMNSNVNQLLYSYNKIYSTSTNLLPHNSDTPMLRMVVVCWPVVSHQIEQVSVLLPEQTNRRVEVDEIERRDEEDDDDDDNDQQTSKEHSMNTPPSSIAKSEYIYLPKPNNLEVEIKLSVQPLKINLDQYTLLFLYEYQENFKRFLTASSRESDSFQMGQSVSSLEFRSPTQTSTHYGQIPVSSVTTGSPLQSHVNHLNDNITTTLQSSTGFTRPMCSSADFTEPNQPVLFIRKVTFYPDLPIHLDYHGRRLDLSGGSFHGLLAMLLQLTNAEFTIPRRVYQRGYQSLDRLIEEVVEDISSILSSQLPHAIVTSLGPMHEVTQFLLGLWDLIYQPVCSLYGTAELPNPSMDPSHIGTTVCKLGLFKKPNRIHEETHRSGEYLSPDKLHSVSRGGIIHGLRRGTRSFSTSTLWATLQLTIQGIRAVQSVAETAYDLVTPGPALRSRRLHLRQPADLREGFGNAVNVMTRGFQMVAEDLCGATVLPSEVEIGYKGPVGMVGDVLRQIPPTMVTPIVAGCEVTANILGGLRNQLRPEAKVEDEQKWKNTYGL